MPSKRKMEANRRREEKRARKVARKQFVLFCVEGNSEVKALGAPIAAMLDGIDPSLDVRFQVMVDRHRRTLEDEQGGDVTSKFGVTPDTIEHVIEKTFLTPFFRSSGLYPRDVIRVVHLVDTDGAFVPDDHVIQLTSDYSDVIYRDGNILTRDAEKLIERNEQKRENIRRLISLSEIKAESKVVPYSVLFFSANLDHFLYGEPNLDRTRKEVMAKDFALECCLRPSLFYDKLQSDWLGGQCDYETSWELIQQGTESLECHSNLAALPDILGY